MGKSGECLDGGKCDLGTFCRSSVHAYTTTAVKRSMSIWETFFAGYVFRSLMFAQERKQEEEEGAVRGSLRRGGDGSLNPKPCPWPEKHVDATVIAITF